MANTKRKSSIYAAKNTFTDRTKDEIEAFAELNVKIQTLDTTLLLLSSAEESVLITVFKHITDFARKQDANVAELREKNLIDLLLEKELFITNESVLVKRFALYIFTTLIESLNTLQDLDTAKTLHIVNLCVQFYMMETDDFCIEYLSVIINKCLDDPQVAREIINIAEFFDTFFAVIIRTENPDVLLHTLEALHKMLQVQDMESMRNFASHPIFPIDRVICDITNEFHQIRSATLKVIKMLIVDESELSPFAQGSGERPAAVLRQLTKLFCDNSMSENGIEVIDVLATAMRLEKMAQIFFDLNLFDKIVQNMEVNSEKYPLETKCKVISIFAETAKYPQFLHKLYKANVTKLFLDCLLASEEEPAAHVILGLNRMMKFPDAANRIVAAYPDGVIEKLLNLMQNVAVNIKTREQAAVLIENLLDYAFIDTASSLVDLNAPEILASIFGQDSSDLSIDYLLTLLSIIETLAQNNEYRPHLGECIILTQNIALLLKNSFSTAVLVNNIFRCLCTLIDEESVRSELLTHYISASIRRGLKSMSNFVKSAVTNFIMQTTRFSEFVHDYIDSGVLEVLIMHQKHAFCVPTWVPAIDSILSKCPSLKFCIRNHLSFTDTTVGNDFLVAKHKFDDFRIFQNILKEECSPFEPILVVNFEREETPSDQVVTVPEHLLALDMVPFGEEPWEYSRRPRDEFLPLYLDDLNRELEKHGLLGTGTKFKRCIDFENVAKRAKLVAEVVARALSEGLQNLDLNSTEECSQHVVKCHLKQLGTGCHCNFIPMGLVRSGCQFERAVLFKSLADQIGLPCTLQRSVNGKILFNEVPLPVKTDQDIHCDKNTMKYMPWRMLRPTHIVDLMYDVGALYPLQSRQAIQYLRLF